MKSVNKYLLAVPFVALLVLTVLGAVSLDSYAKGDKAKGPKCKYIELGGTKIIAYNCDRFQSKGDIDEATPQIKIVSPYDGEDIDYSLLEDTVSPMETDTDVELPITIVVSNDYVVDFTLASGADPVQRYSLPQERGVGHAHAYCAPVIDVDAVVADIDADPGESPLVSINSVDFVGADNRSDFVCGFCVFGARTTPPGGDYQICSTRCDLQGGANIVAGQPYRIIVDTTENSHGPRMKAHPRDVPSGDQVIVTFSNVPAPAPE